MNYIDKSRLWLSVVNEFSKCECCGARAMDMPTYKTLWQCNVRSCSEFVCNKCDYCTWHNGILKMNNCIIYAQLESNPVSRDKRIRNSKERERKDKLIELVRHKSWMENIVDESYKILRLAHNKKIPDVISKLIVSYLY